MEKKVGIARCGNCNEVIFGSKIFPIGRAGRISKTEKRTTRYFAGNFCFSCLREIFKERARSLVWH